MTTLNNLIDRVINHLNGSYTNRPVYGTVTELIFGSFGEISSLKLAPITYGYPHQGPALFEIDNHMIYVSNFDSATGMCDVPFWGNGHGTDPLPGQPASERVTIDPLWSRWIVGQHVIDAIRGLYPTLFGIGYMEFTSDVNAERYPLDAGAERILKVNVEGYGPNNPRTLFRHFSIETRGDSDAPYLTIKPVGLSGRPMRVWYRKAPTEPTDPADTDWTWESSGLPASAADLPVLAAASTLIISPELAKTQVFSAEQSDRSRFVQPGSSTSVSRRLTEQYDRRLSAEQTKLREMYPPQMHIPIN